MLSHRVTSLVWIFLLHSCSDPARPYPTPTESNGCDSPGSNAWHTAVTGLRGMVGEVVTAEIRRAFDDGEDDDDDDDHEDDDGEVDDDDGGCSMRQMV